MNASISAVAGLLLLPWMTVAVPLGAEPQTRPTKVLVVPKDVGTASLKERAEAQLATLDQFQTFLLFRFTDRLAESGVRFRHQIVDDAGKHYKPVHYDHGNGLSVADVDGDGLYDVYFLTQIGSNQLWKNLGDGRFTDITEAAGVGLADRISVTASFADIDNDAQGNVTDLEQMQAPET